MQGLVEKKEPKQIKEFQLSKWTIKIKLITIISIIFVLSISTMILLATYFFREDSRVRIIETNMKIADAVGSEMRTEFASIIEKVKLILITMVMEDKKNDKNVFLDIFFQDDKDLLMIGEYAKDGDKLNPVFSPRYNTEALKELELNEFDLDKSVYMHARNFMESFTGKDLVHNISLGTKLPTFAISVPRDRKTLDTIIIVVLRTNRIKGAFQQSKTGITEIFLINDRGDIIVHPEEQSVLNEKNLFELPIIQEMLKSKLDSGQKTYYDKIAKEEYIGSYKKIGFAGVGVISTVPEKKAFAEVYRIQRRNILIMTITLCIAFLIIYNYSNTLTTPLLKLVLATKEIEAGNFHVPIQPTSKDEVGLLTNSFVDMGKGLEERDKVKNILGNMVDPVVVKEAMIDLQALKRGAEKQITAFFSDVASFSTISEKLSSVDLATLLNEYLSAMTIILKQHNGVLDKYIGDAIVGIFNAPVDVPNHPLEAAKASVEMIKKLNDLRDYWTKNGLYIKEAQAMDIRIGLNTGPAKVGFMGTDALASYTMMGDTVNLAARLEAAGKDYGVNILVSENTKKGIEQEMFIRFLDLVRVKGKHEPVQIYELVCSKKEVPRDIVESAEIYNEAFQLYLKQDWTNAIAKFSEVILLSQKKDKAAELLIDRCVYYSNSNPGENWDGVFTRKHK